MDEKSKKIVEFFSDSISCDVSQLEEFIKEGLDLNGPLSLEDGRRPLHAAAKKGNMERVQVLLDRGAYIDVPDYYGNTALHYASKEGHLEVVQLLMDKGANLNLENDKGCSVLQSAVCNEQVEITRLLLTREEIKVIVDEPFEKRIIPFNLCCKSENTILMEKTALFFASDLGNIPLINELLSAGANVNAKFNLPFINTVRKGDNKMVKFWIDHGVDINKMNMHGEYPLDVAIKCGHYETVGMLLASGAKINKPDPRNNIAKGSLCLAFFSGEMEIARLLLEEGADISPSQVVRAMFCTIEKDCDDLTEHLLNQGVDLDVLDGLGNCLNKAIEKENMKIVNLILGKGINVNIRDWSRETALILATRRNLVSMVELLLEKGADINICDSKGKTAAYYSIIGNQSLHIWEIFMNVVNSIDEIVFTTSDDTILVDEIRSLNYPLIKFLLLKGANVNVKNLNGCTPLHSLIKECLYNRQEENDWMKCTELLLEAGADILCANCKAEKPLNMVIEKCSTNVVRVFLEKGLRIDKDNVASIASILYDLVRYNHVSLIGLLLNKALSFYFEEVMKSCNISDSEAQDANELNHEIIENLKTDGVTVLHLAAYKGSLSLMNIGLQSGVDIDEVTKEKFTPLQIALYKCNFELAKHLIDKGANVNIRDKYGVLPIHIAINHGNISVLDQLYDRTNLNDCRILEIPLSHFAVCHGNISLLNFLLNKGTDLNTRDEKKNTVLHVAAKIHNSEMINLLLEKGVDRDVKNVFGDTELLTALKVSSSLDSSQLEVVNSLLRHRVKINAMDSDGKTALHLAVDLKLEPLIKLLLESDVNVLSNDKNGNSPFSIFVSHLESKASFSFDPTEIVISFLNHGADFLRIRHGGSFWSTLAKHIDFKRVILTCNIKLCLMMKDKEKYDLLNQAVIENNYDLIELLLSQGFTCNSSLCSKILSSTDFLDAIHEHEHLWQMIFNKDGWGFHELLLNSVKKTDANLTKTLLDKIADVGACRSWQETPFEQMYSFGKVKKYGLVQMFLDRGVDVNCSSNMFHVPLALTAKAGNCWLVNVLIDKGADLNTPSCSGYSALHHAALAGQENVVKTLLARGADVDILDLHNASPLYLAAHRGHSEITKLLIENGANLEVKATGGTPVQAAVCFGSYETVNVLTDSGANLSVTDHNGNTLLHNAKSPEVAQLLIRRGASVHAENYFKETPLFPARTNERLRTGQSKKETACTVYQVLIECGSVVNSQNILGKTPLHLAAVADDSGLITFLVNNGAKTDVVDHQGRTALHDAVRWCKQENVKLLLANGASTDVKDESGRTCFSIASSQSKKVLAKFFLKQKLAEISCDEKVNIAFSPEEKAVCLKELDRIKQTVIGDEFCLYEIFSRCQKPRYLFDTELAQEIEALFQSNYLDQFPNFGIVLRHTFIRSKHSKFVFTQRAIDTMRYENRKKVYRNMPYEVLEIIFNFLNVTDLEKIVESGDERVL